MAKSITRFNGSSHVRALVVDDDEISKTLIMNLLRSMGAASVQTASDGLHGLGGVFSGAEIDAVICDLTMEPMDGLSVLAAVRSSMRDDVARIPFILFTAVENIELHQRAKALGADAVIVKPYNPYDLSGYIHDLVVGYKATRPVSVQ